MQSHSKDFILQTQKVWGEYASEPISAIEAKEIAVNMVALFELLKSLDKKYGKEI